MDRTLVATLVEGIRHAPEDSIMQNASLLGNRLPSDYLAHLSDQDKVDAARACLIVSIITEGRVVPRWKCSIDVIVSLSLVPGAGKHSAYSYHCSFVLGPCR